MKIMLGSDTYPPDVNGAARFTERLGRGLIERGHEVHLVAPSPVGRAYTENRDGVIVHRVRSHRYPLVENFQICMPWEARPQILRTVREVRPDVCHAQAHFVCGRYLIYAADELGVPLVATNHFMPENLVDQVPLPLPQLAGDLACRWAWKDFARVFRRAQIVTAPTPRAVDLLKTGPAHMDDALPVSCGIDAAKYAAAAENFAPHDVPVILFVGRLDQEKRVNELIEACARLPQDQPYRLEIVGDGSCRDEWKALVAKLGIGDHVRFRGFVSEADLIEAYGSCDLFCQPCIAELQSLASLEAMSAGKPIVAANAMALPHLCHDQENGFLFEPGDIDGLAERLLRLLRDPELRLTMGEESRRIVAQHEIGATLDQFLALYERAITERRDERAAA